jgi:hypothetical protein
MIMALLYREISMPVKPYEANVTTEFMIRSVDNPYEYVIDTAKSRTTKVG